MSINEFLFYWIKIKIRAKSLIVNQTRSNPLNRYPLTALSFRKFTQQTPLKNSRLQLSGLERGERNESSRKSPLNSNFTISFRDLYFAIHYRGCAASVQTNYHAACVVVTRRCLRRISNPRNCIEMRFLCRRTPYNKKETIERGYNEDTLTKERNQLSKAHVNIHRGIACYDTPRWHVSRLEKSTIFETREARVSTHGKIGARVA